jgi:hypothetical protein
MVDQADVDGVHDQRNARDPQRVPSIGGSHRYEPKGPGEGRHVRYAARHPAQCRASRVEVPTRHPSVSQDVTDRRHPMWALPHRHFLREHQQDQPHVAGWDAVLTPPSGGLSIPFRAQKHGKGKAHRQENLRLQVSAPPCNAQTEADDDENDARPERERREHSDASVSSDRRAQDRANSREGHRRHSADKNSNKLPNNLVPPGSYRYATAFGSRKRCRILASHGNERGGGPDRQITQDFCDKLLAEYQRQAS